MPSHCPEHEHEPRRPKVEEDEFAMFYGKFTDVEAPGRQNNNGEEVPHTATVEAFDFTLPGLGPRKCTNACLLYTRISA